MSKSVLSHPLYNILAQGRVGHSCNQVKRSWEKRLEMVQDGGLGHSHRKLLFFQQAHQVYSYMQINPIWKKLRNQLRDNCTSKVAEKVAPLKQAGKCETNSSYSPLRHCTSQLKDPNTQLLHRSRDMKHILAQFIWVSWGDSSHPPALKASGDSLVVLAKTCAQCRGPRFSPLSGN